MKFASRLIGLLGVFLLSWFALSAGAQRADSEPTLAQIYQAANSGELQKAQGLIDQVLKAHPDSARAHYVKAELAARDKDFNLARAELSAAERLAPGLPFARPESVQALQNQINAPPRGGSTGGGASPAPAGADPGHSAGRSATGLAWGLGGLVAAVVVVALVMRRAGAAVRALEGGSAGEATRPAAPHEQTGPTTGPGAAANAPGQGPTIMRGLGAGLAVGAGALAAHELGRRILAEEGQPAPEGQRTGSIPPDLDAIDEGMRRKLNTGMGGENFGIADDVGWDDAGGAAAGDAGGDDWNP
ncbi:hypothetical protein GCM10027034_40750 [Ramlibacter solisilvae]|uniref:Tetratricopeptide repeat protein n=1 Tax=Ramlibacter tataouinensis TaxID=94132 RepID=A0A127JU04_9BURK|nr:hypothetical protein [Ramlibacter tataouinensis]AMO23430.1 hypothetical protein UC35_11650 [Ramlibacter tataouinensis]